MKVKAAPVSALNLAVEANARNLMSRNGNMRQMAFSRYGAALASVRKAMMHYTLVADAASLMAMMMIDIFESICLLSEELSRFNPTSALPSIEWQNTICKGDNLALDSDLKQSG
ncbi:hypothetical protein FPHYL_6911 [Fusarium phyllophilum]|uniref:Uncharacterized protein n=1 Tax=Fusarium phyllophilum TaxID=47803 RepID=A0A8H5JSC5_9HYPO|nr:hypothetical protein FPHYL_6911 [Fusarium phyllophilum]